MFEFRNTNYHMSSSKRKDTWFRQAGLVYILFRVVLGVPGMGKPSRKVPVCSVVGCDGRGVHPVCGRCCSEALRALRKRLFVRESPRVSPGEIPTLPGFALFKQRFAQDFGQLVARVAVGDVQTAHLKLVC